MQFGGVSKKEINLRFGTTVKRLRHQLGISQEILAERAGLDRTYIGHVERGARNVSLFTIDKLARALRVSTATLLAEPSEHVLLRADTKAGQTRAHGVDILLVEDRRSDAELTLRAFKRAEITNPIHVVSDGEEALEFLFRTGRYAAWPAGERPQLILLDLNLPRLGGMEVLRRVKADERTTHIPVIVLTVSQGNELVAQAMRLGAAAYITKPVGFQNLSEVTPKLRLSWTLAASRSTRAETRKIR